MAFPPHHKLFPTFSSASSSASEQSLGRNSCAAIFLQLFDWNCRHHRRRVFRRKSLPAERRSSPVDDKICRAEHPPSEDSPLAAENSNLLPPRTRAGSIDEDGLYTPEKKKKKKRAPNVVAKLMGLETMPSPEVLSKRQPLNPWNLNVIPDSKASYCCSDSSFRGRPVKLEKRMVGVNEDRRWSSKHHNHGNGNSNGLVGARASNTRYEAANAVVSTMLSPSTQHDHVSASVPSPSKIYKPIVSPIKRTLTSKNTVCIHGSRNNSLPESSMLSRKPRIVRSLVTSSTMAGCDEEKNRNGKAENKKAAHLNSSLDTSSKRRCTPSILHHNLTSVLSLSEQERSTLKEEETLSAPTCSKRQRVSTNRAHHNHTLAQTGVKQDRKARNERTSTSMIQTGNRKRGHTSLGNSTNRQDEIVQRLMQGKSAQGKDYGKCNHNEPRVSIGMKSKLAKGSHQRNKAKDEIPLTLKLHLNQSDSPKESTAKSKDSCIKNNISIKNDRLPCLSGKETRNSSPLLKSLLIKRAAVRGVADELEISMQQDSASSIEESGITSIEESGITSIEESGITSIEERGISSIEERGISSIDKNRGANLPGLESFDDDIENESSASCITEDNHRAEDISSTYYADLNSDTRTHEECHNERYSYFTSGHYEDDERSIGYDETVGGEEVSKFCHGEITESRCQSICKSSTEEAEDTASTSSSRKIHSVSYSGKSTATILQELLLSLNLSMEQSTLKEDISQEKLSRHAPTIGFDMSSKLQTIEENASSNADGGNLGTLGQNTADNRSRHYSDDSTGSTFIFNKLSDDTTEVLRKFPPTGKHTLRECNDKCWDQDSYQDKDSIFLQIPLLPKATEKHLNGDGYSFIPSKANKVIQSEGAYINYILSNACLSPYAPYSPKLGFTGTLIESSLFFKLEKDNKHMWKCGFNEPNKSSNNDDMWCSYDEATRGYRKLVFDCVKEALDLDMKSKSWLVEHHSLPPTSYMAMDIHRKLDDWKGMACGMNVDDMVENSMNTDGGKWVDFSQEACNVSMEVEIHILSDLIDELVMEMGPL